jgi:hypothetical protein
MTEKTLAHMGLSTQEGKHGAPSEVRAARMGNWERDLSQALMPATKPIMDPIMGILNILAIKDFGRGFTLEGFGTYDPVEHIDNPALLRADGAFKQGTMDATGASQYESLGPSMLQEEEDGGNKAWADVDKRYQDVYDQKKADGAKFMPGEDVAAFQVDESGIPIYMQTSKEMLKRQLKSAMRLARRGNDGKGPRLFSSAVHIMQDYYAHSNFAEIAINILLREGTVEIADEHGHVQKYDYKKDFGGNVLNTGVHGLGKDGVTPDAGNLMFNGREVMTTGSFNLTDTVASILEEVSDKWKQFNPFKKGTKEPSKLIAAALDFIEMESPTEFNGVGKWISSTIKEYKSEIESIGGTAADIVEGAGSGAGSAIKTGGSWVATGLDLASNWGPAGTSAWFKDAAKNTAAASDAAGDAVKGKSSEAADGIRNALTQLDAFATSCEDKQHLLRNGYLWVWENFQPIEAIANAAAKIPKIGPDLAKLIRTIGDKIKDKLEETFGAAWNIVIDKGVVKINKAISAVRAATNADQKKTAGAGSGTKDEIAKKFGAVGDMYEKDASGKMVPKKNAQGIAPKSYNPPSHTEVAKDHNDLSQGAADHKHDDAGDPVSKKEEEAHEHPKEDETHEHDHGHVHIGAWLSPIAEGMAHAATRGMGEPVNAGWNALEAKGGTSDPNPGPGFPNSAACAGQDAEIDAAVDRWFAHPADTRSTWEGFVKGQLKNTRLGGELIKRMKAALEAAKPGAPKESGDKELVAATAPGGNGPAPKSLPGVDQDKKNKVKGDNHDLNKDHYDEHRDKAHLGHAHGDDDHDHDHDHAHGADEHKCGPKCGDHPNHGQDKHACGPGCGDYSPHGNDAHQCTVNCEKQAA